MPENEALPNEFPPMGADFKKPYMEFEYEGQLYKLEELKGGHNGRGMAKACKTHGAQWDEEKQRWVVKVENNLIDIDIASQPETTRGIPDSKAFLKKLDIFSNPRRSKKSIGYLYASGNKDEAPRYPIDCEFHMHIRVKVPGKPSLQNPKPFILEAKGLNAWPPEIGTVYLHDDEVELYPEWVPFAEQLMKPIVKILPGDKTIITEVYEARESTDQKESIFTKALNWLT
jgi:hypothetical protein